MVVVVAVVVLVVVTLLLVPGVVMMMTMIMTMALPRVMAAGVTVVMVVAAKPDSRVERDRRRIAGRERAG